MKFARGPGGGGGGALNVEVGLGQEEQQATIGIGSRQTVHVLQEDGTIEPAEHLRENVHRDQFVLFTVDQADRHAFVGTPALADGEWHPLRARP